MDPTENNNEIRMTQAEFEAIREAGGELSGTVIITDAPGGPQTIKPPDKPIPKRCAQVV